MRLIVYSRTRLFAECLASGLLIREDVTKALGLFEIAEVFACLARDRPCALIVDLSQDEAWDDAARLQPFCGETLLLGLAVRDTPEEVIRCARVGCAGIVERDSSIERMVATIRRALRGELSCSPRSAAGLMRALSPAGDLSDSLPECLTRRETEICGLVCEGLTNKQIARELNCSEGTVKNHVHHILGKLNVTRRSGLPRKILVQRIGA
jgi:DNA-binding NarL/FixJ family response regulator